MLSKSNYGGITDADTIGDEILKEYADNITISQELRLAFMDDRIIHFISLYMNLKQEKLQNMNS